MVMAASVLAFASTYELLNVPVVALQDRFITLAPSSMVTALAVMTGGLLLGSLSGAAFSSSGHARVALVSGCVVPAVGFLMLGLTGLHTVALFGPGLAESGFGLASVGGSALIIADPPGRMLATTGAAQQSVYIFAGPFIIIELLRILMPDALILQGEARRMSAEWPFAALVCAMIAVCATGLAIFFRPPER